MSSRIRSLVLFVLGLAAIVAIGWLTWAPRGFVVVEGDVKGEGVWELSRLQAGGQSNAEHYIELYGDGRVSLFRAGRDLAGSVFLSRNAGGDGLWHCGRVTRGEFDFREGSLNLADVRVILDENSAARDGTLTVSGFWGAHGQCSEEAAIEGTIEGQFKRTSSSANQDMDLREAGFIFEDQSIRIIARHAEPGADGTMAIEDAWVRHTIYGETTERRVYAAGPGSRLVPDGSCLRLELRAVTEAGVCGLGPGDGALEVSW